MDETTKAAPPATLPHLDTFRLAAEVLNFTATARALGITQAAVSQRIAALEQALGVPLFVRAKGRVTLSPAGERVLPIVRRIHQMHAALAEAARLSAEGGEAS
jgi:DNA-binding transcriptional LysR family regulator